MLYDGDGNRASKTVAGVTTTYLVDTQNPTGYVQVLQEIFSGNTGANYESLHTYVYGLERISERRYYVQSGQSAYANAYYVYDGHGSVRALANSTGAVTDTYDYDAFGNLLHSAGTTPNNYLFAGDQFDPDLNLYYNRARYLNVSTGRFWSMDPYEGDSASPSSLHKYLYVFANPANLTDPSGDTPLSDFVAQLNAYLRMIGKSGTFTSRGIGVIAHAAIETDIFQKLFLTNIFVPEYVLPGGRVDLIVDSGLYEIKPLGGTVDPNLQVQRYLKALKFLQPGTIPFDDYVNPALLPILPDWVQLHYELTSPGVIEYDFQFNLELLVTEVVLVTIVASVRIALVASQVDFSVGWAGAYAY